MTKAEWRRLQKAVLVAPGTEAKLCARDPVGEGLIGDREAAEAQTRRDGEAIDVLQDRLFAEGRRSLLVVLQGIDTSGKDGTVRGVFNVCGPLGVRVTPFGRPSELELSHDYLWRAHQACPPKGMIGIWNRSHYEDVLVVKVRGLAPAEAVAQRYAQINAFEKHLSENGTTILKFMLHISRDEQKQRLQERLDDPTKHWKFNPGDLDDRKLWPAYQAAYEEAVSRCSTDWAPWRVIPADKKWRRNALVATIVRGTLEAMDPQYPKATFDPKVITIE
jgi:PPK2 family polyphosphate:nucleotide phosphotransferase